MGSGGVTIAGEAFKEGMDAEERERKSRPRNPRLSKKSAEVHMCSLASVRLGTGRWKGAEDLVRRTYRKDKTSLDIVLFDTLLHTYSYDDRDA